MTIALIAVLVCGSQVNFEALPPAPLYSHDSLDRFGVISFPFQEGDMLLLNEARKSKQAAGTVLAKAIARHKTSRSLSSFLAMVHISRRAQRSNEVMTYLSYLYKEAAAKQQTSGFHYESVYRGFYLYYAYAVLRPFSTPLAKGDYIYHAMTGLKDMLDNKYEQVMLAMCSESRGNYSDVHAHLLLLIEKSKNSPQRRDFQLAYAVSLKWASAKPDVAQGVFAETRSKRTAVFETLCRQYPDWGLAAYFLSFEHLFSDPTKARRLLLLAISDKSMNPELKSRAHLILTELSK